MKVAAISELKAKLARYLRLVKAGEEVEIQERGVPVAILKGIHGPKANPITAPRKAPARLGKMQFSVKPKKNFDIAALLSDERRKR